MPSYTQLVRTVTGVPTVANFANMDGTPIVIDDSTGNAYVMVNGIVIRLGGSILTTLTNSLAADVNLSNVGNYFDGPSVAQGTTGTWFASGTITVTDTAGVAAINAKLWDGTNTISSGRTIIPAANQHNTITLSGRITSPTGNIRISANDPASTSGIMRANISGNAMDSTITVLGIA